MRSVRAAIAIDPRSFGRRMSVHEVPAEQPPLAFSDELKLFLVTFAAGFLFTTILIA